MESARKPLTIIREEFVSSVLDLCNNVQMPLFCIEDVLKELLREVHDLSVQQYKQDKQAYGNYLKEQAEKEESKNANE